MDLSAGLSAILSAIAFATAEAFAEADGKLSVGAGVEYLGGVAVVEAYA